MSVVTPTHGFHVQGGNREFFLSTHPETVAVGPAGTGKTMTAVMRCHLTALSFPEVRILFARKVLEDLKTGALHTYVNKVKPEDAGVVPFGGNRFYPAEFRYPNGSVITVVGMDKPGKVMSAEYDIIYINEATELAETDWKALKTRLRNGRYPHQMLLGDCNPNGPRHWLKRRADGGSLRLIPTTHRDNPGYWDARAGNWTALGKQYVEENLSTLTGLEYERLYLGKWAAAEGLVYPEFAPADHVRAVDVTGWRCVLGVDVGTRNPTAILVAHISGDGRIHITEELYRRKMSASEIVSAIDEYSTRYDPDQIFIDPSAASYIQDLENLGHYVERANNDILVGIQRVHAQFQAGLTVDPSCTDVIDEFGMYAYPDNPRVETDKPIKEHDHAMDALRYLCMGVAVEDGDFSELEAYERNQGLR